MAGEKKVTKDTYLFKEGDAPDAMYIVKSGLLAITKTKGNSDVVLAEVGIGSMVGEMALFDMKPRSANVKAVKDSEVIALPYDSLHKQMEQLPVWVKAIMKNLNENLRDANKKIKNLENATGEEERFPPHVVNKFISIINLVMFKYGKQDAKGPWVSSHLLRNYTIQVFQEATNKMTAVIHALTELGMLASEDRGDGTQKIINLKPNELFQFVDWYNEWLFKQEKDRMPALKDEEVKVLQGLLLFAAKAPVDNKGFHKVNLFDVQNDSMKETGALIKPEDVNSLIEKKYIPDKIMDEKSTYALIAPGDLAAIAKNWQLVNALKKKLK